MATRKKGKSPYKKYAKAPFLYSAAHQHWKKAVKEQRSGAEIRRLAEEHTAYCIKALGFRPTWFVAERRVA